MRRDELDELLAKLRPISRDLADSLWMASVLDPQRRNDITAVARAAAAEALGETYGEEGLLLEPPDVSDANGVYRLGRVVYANRIISDFGLRDTDLPQHIAILGRSGAGKSNVGYLLVWNLLRHRKPFMVLDWRRNYRHLSARAAGGDVAVLSVGERKSLSFNPLDPPAGLSDNQRDAYLRDVVSTLCTTCLPGDHLLSTRGVEYLMLSALQALAEATIEPATFNAVTSYIGRWKVRSREHDWKASARNVLLRLTSGPLGRTFNSSDGASLPDLLYRPAILELDGLGSQTDRAVFSKCLLLWLYYHRLAEGRSATSKHVLIVEEAHHCFMRQRDGSQSLHDLLLRQMRDLGQGLVLLDQNPSLLSVPAMGNTATTICLNLKHADDLEAAGKALGLPRDKWKLLGRLPVGQGIVRVQGRHATPFLVDFPLFPVKRSPKTSQTERSPLATASVQRRAEEARRLLDEATRALRENARREEKETRIGNQERSLIMDVVEHPFSGVTERYGRLGWSAYRGTKLKRGLLRQGLLDEVRLRVPEGTVTLLELTEQAKDLLGQEGIEVRPFPKNASLEHEYWKHRVAEDYRSRGYEVEEEVHIGGGRTVDLVATKDDERIAIEIETGKSDAERNRRKCAEAGFDEVRVIHTGF